MRFFKQKIKEIFFRLNCLPAAVRIGPEDDPGKEGDARDRPHELHLRTIVALLVLEEHEPQPLRGREQAPAWQLLFSGVVSFTAVTWL